MPALDTLDAVSLGDTEQWIRIRSHDPDRPLLLILYGGPGLPVLPRVHDLGVRAGLEAHYTVVYWEQRGTGKSYTPSLSAADMTIDRFVDDVCALTDLLRSRFDRDTIGLFGTSWGTLLGLKALARRPEAFWVFVGSGLLTNPLESDRRSYEFTLNEAKRREQEAAIEELEAIGPPPFTPKTALGQRKWLGEFGGIRHNEMPPGPFGRLWELATTSAYTWGDFWQIASDPFFALNHLLDELYETDLTDDVSRVEVPVHVLQGRHDQLTPASVVEPYVEALEAPSKEWTWFEQSAHFLFLDEPDRFKAVMGNVADRLAP